MEKTDNMKTTAPVHKTFREYLPEPFIDDDGTTKYVGYAPTGVQPDQKGWQIVKFTKDGNVTKAEYPFGSMGFDYVWDERATYTYGR